jgi:hypothetical protein
LPSIGEKGETAVARELKRRGFEVRRLGLAHEYDLAAKKNGREIKIQVKTIHAGDFQSSAIKFLKIDIVDGKQSVKGKQNLPNPRTVWIFVDIIQDKYKFYLLYKKDVQNAIFKRYTKALRETKIPGRRPKNPYSFHCTIKIGDLKKWENKWSILQAQ